MFFYSFYKEILCFDLFLSFIMLPQGAVEWEI